MDGAAASDPLACTIPDTSARFCYEQAFSRNLGWLTEWEQQALRGKRVAISGMGVVGGFHLLTLARFGIGAFNIADLDRFELVNLNRQVGATLSTIGRPKSEVMAESARHHRLVPNFTQQAFRYELAPTTAQAAFLASCTGASRFWFNQGLALVKARLDERAEGMGRLWRTPRLRATSSFALYRITM